MAVGKEVTRLAAAAVLPEGEAARLARRAAGARGLFWPADERAVRGVGGLTADLAGTPGPERLAWATLNGRDGVIGLFSGDRLLDSPNRSLGEILRVQPIRLPGLPHRALMVDDRVDQRTGAYLVEERRRIYVWDGRHMRQVYLGILRREQLVHAQWTNPRAPAVWRRLRQEGEIRLKGLILSERSRIVETEAVGSPQEPVPPESRFRLRREEVQERQLRWDPRLRRFESV